MNIIKIIVIFILLIWGRNLTRPFQNASKHCFAILKPQATSYCMIIIIICKTYTLTDCFYNVYCIIMP